MDKEKFAQRFKQLREKTKMTQKELAATLGVKRSTVGSWESAHRVPEIETAQKAARIFNVLLDYLVGNTDNPTPPHVQDKPTPEQYVLSAPTIGEAIIRMSELLNTDQIDEVTALNLVALAHKKFGLPPVPGAEPAAGTDRNIPGTGILIESKKEDVMGKDKGGNKKN